MPTIALAGQRPGAGKTLLTTELAVCAGNALVVDLDPGGGATRWSRRRGGEWPHVVAAAPDTLGAAVRAAGEAGYSWVFVDLSSQADVETVWLAMDLAEYTLIPSRPGMVDLNAVGGLARVLRSSSAHVAVVLNGFMPGVGRLAETLLQQAFIEARRHGLPICPHVRTERAVVAAAFGAGQVALETEPDSKASAEIGELWSWINREVAAASSPEPTPAPLSRVSAETPSSGQAIAGVAPLEA